MNVGGLRRRIQIQRAAIARSDDGSTEKSFATHYSAWAKVKEVSETENVVVDKRTTVKSLEFTIRYSSEVVAVNPSDRVVYNGSNYDIKSCITDERKFSTVIIGELIQ
jgi:SPP1 family predicted phage head-tail adaptor